MLRIKNGKLVILFIIAMATVSFCIQTRGDQHEPPPEPPKMVKYEVNVGFGFSDSDGSGTLQAAYWPKKHLKMFAQIWSDNSDNGDEFVLRRTAPSRTLTVQGDDGDTSNLALGGAYCGYLAVFRYCAGAAILADDKTSNIDDQVELYLEAGYKLPENDYVDYVGVFNIDDEVFVGVGRGF